MKPPICALCGERFDLHSGGGLLSFRKHPADKAWYRRAARPGFIGHPPHQAWFCGPHRAQAAALTDRTLRDALAELRKAASSE